MKKTTHKDDFNILDSLYRDVVVWAVAEKYIRWYGVTSLTTDDVIAISITKLSRQLA